MVAPAFWIHPTFSSEFSFWSSALSVFSLNSSVQDQEDRRIVHEKTRNLWWNRLGFFSFLNVASGSDGTLDTDVLLQRWQTKRPIFERRFSQCWGNDVQREKRIVRGAVWRYEWKFYFWRSSCCKKRPEIPNCLEFLQVMLSPDHNVSCLHFRSQGDFCQRYGVQNGNLPAKQHCGIRPAKRLHPHLHHSQPQEKHTFWNEQFETWTRRLWPSIVTIVNVLLTQNHLLSHQIQAGYW